MPTHHILVDFENVQPKDFDLLKDGPFRVKVFLGPNQAKVPIAMATAMQVLGSNAEYLVLEFAGSNALDFHIAYYIGVLSAQDPHGCFHIISKDSGFDALIKHLKRCKVRAQRATCIADISYFKPDLPASLEDQIAAIVRDLTRRKAAKPRTPKTLRNTLHALFRKELTESQLDALLNALCDRGIVRIEGARVVYELPAAD